MENKEKLNLNGESYHKMLDFYTYMYDFHMNLADSYAEKISILRQECFKNTKSEDLDDILKEKEVKIKLGCNI